MLTFQLTPYRDAGWRWASEAGRYTTGDGGSTICPLRHPLLEHVAATDGDRTLIIVRERVAGRVAASPEVVSVSGPEFSQLRELVPHWPVGYVAIETGPNAPVTVTTGTCQSAPLFVATDRETLFGSWDMADLRPHAQGLNAKETSRLLIYRPRYSHETVFRGIHRLTERSTATFGGGLTIQYPPPVLHARSGPLRDDADVLEAFIGQIDAGLDRRPIDPDATVLHLTAGFDSGSIATRAAERYPGRFATAALLIDGPGRAQQLRRRKELRARLDFAPTDTVVDAVEYPPLHPECHRVAGDPISPYEEPLHYPFEMLTSRLAGLGAEAVVTGLGGDEMVAVTAGEHPHPAMEMAMVGYEVPWLGKRARAAIEYGDDNIAPPAAINSMTLLALETAAPPLIRHGIWPLHPFATPAMVRLGERLPYDWRELKQLQRRRLRQLGYSDDVTLPTERESFAEIVERSLRTWGTGLLRNMLDQGSPLIEEDLIDPDGLRGGIERLESGPFEEGIDAKLIQVTTLHLAAVAYL